MEELIVVLGLSVGIILLFRRFKLPGVLGFILTGALAGPHGFGLVESVDAVEMLAEIGVIFLLFVIGMEFNLKKLASIGKAVFVGGLLQAGLTVAGVAVIARILGLAWPSAVFTGFLVSLSSTAIVLRGLQEKGQLEAPFGRLSSAILIFQDILVVPMMLVTPMLAGRSADPGGDLLKLLAKMVVLIAVVYVSGRFLVPRLLKSVARGRNRELFLITIVGLCMAAAWGTSALGLSLALGAFFAGLIISETDEAYQATGLIQPLHGLFMSFFFVSIGMLVDTSLFLRHPFSILGLTVLAIGVKIVAAFTAVWLLRYPLRTAMLSALALFQVGEFAFVLALPGLELDLIGEAHYQLFLAVSILSMGITPFVMEYADTITRRLFTAFLSPAIHARLEHFTQVKRRQEKETSRKLKDHVVVIGYGLNGQNVVRAARTARIRCAVIEEDPTLVRKAADQADHVVQGDAANDHVLEKAHVGSARVVVVAISDADATRKITSLVRAHSTAYLIVRTRYVHEIEANIALGANEVIPEEFETSIEIFYRVLRKYLVPENSIKQIVAGFRKDHYGMLRGTSVQTTAAPQETLVIPGLEIATLPVTLGRTKVVGRSVKEVGLREKYGITVLAIRRGGRYITNINGAVKIHQDDMLYLLGSPDGIVRLDQELR
jgi:CPA2 family monovalent cation:H+ antiporter-2